MFLVDKTDPQLMALDSKYRAKHHVKRAVRTTAKATVTVSEVAAIAVGAFVIAALAVASVCGG